MSRIKKMLLLNLIGVVAIFVITLISQNTFKLDASLSGLPYNEYLMNYGYLDDLPYAISFTILVINVFDLISLKNLQKRSNYES